MSIDNIVAEANQEAATVAAAQPTVAEPAQAAVQQQAQAQVPVTIHQGAQGTAVAVAADAPTPLTMDTVGGGQLAAEAWLKASDQGFYFTVEEEDTAIVVDVPVILEMKPDEGFFVCEAIRYGNPAEYKHTYDRRVANSGEPWSQALTQAQQIDASCRPYAAVQLILLAAEDIKDFKGQVVVEEGTEIGHTTSVTAFAGWKKFYRQCQTAGLLGKTLQMTLQHKPRKNKKGKWGEIKFPNAADCLVIES